MALSITTQEPQISQLDALWALFQAQTKSVRKAFTQRILEQAALTKKKPSPKSSDDDVAAMTKDKEKVSTWKKMGLSDEAAKSAAQSCKEYNRGEYAFKGTAAEAIEFLNSL